MTKFEFATCTAILEAGAGKTMSKEQVEVYFDLLGDLPVEALLIACKRALLESFYPTIPPIGTLRKMAVSTMQGRISELTAAEAWGLVTKAAGKCDVDQAGSVERAFKDIPPLVWRAVQLFGFMAIYNLPSNAIETARAQFMRIYESLSANEEKLKLLPASVKEEIAQIGKRQEQQALPARVQAIAGQIGVFE